MDEKGKFVANMHPLDANVVGFRENIVKGFGWVIKTIEDQGQVSKDDLLFVVKMCDNLKKDTLKIIR